MGVNDINNSFPVSNDTEEEIIEKPEEKSHIDMHFSFFKRTILENSIDNFYPGYLRGKGDIAELKAEKEEWTKRYFDMFMTKIDKFINDIDGKKYKDYGDFKFVKEHIIKIFEYYYLKKPLKDVFGGNKDIEEKFFNLSEKYIFNASSTYGDIEEFKKSLLTDEEKEILLRSIQDQ